MTLHLTTRMVALAACATALLQATSRDYSAWMAELPDNAFVSTLSIPGSHDTATGEGFTSSTQAKYSQTQDRTINEQMAIGVRAFDLRPGVNRSGELKCYHGTSEIKLTIEEALNRMCDFLDEHPSEFFVIHLFQGNNNNGEAIRDKMNQVLSSAKISPRLMEFRPNLSVGDMRGRIVFVRRWDLAGWENNSAAVVYNWNTNSSNTYSFPNGSITALTNGWEAQLAVQDVAHTNGNDMNKKLTAIGQLLSYSTSMTIPDRTTITWVFNFLSAYTDYLISSNKGYLENASKTNAYLLDYINSSDYTPGPLGIVMADWVGGDSRTISSSTYNSRGEELVKAIADNNFSYIDAITPAAACPLFTLNTNSAFSREGYRGNVEWVDVDNDGWLDLIHKHRNTAQGWATEINLYKNNEGTIDSRIQLPDVDGAGWNRVVVPVEYDRDGQVDLILGASWGSKMLHNNSGSLTHKEDFTLWGGEISFEDGHIEQRAQGVMLSADFDLNGRQEILTFSGEGFPVIFKNENAVFYGGDSSWLPRVKDGTMAIGDYNADGLPDILISGLNPDSGSRELWLCLNTCTGEHSYSFDNHRLDNLAPYATTSGIIDMADLNNDGLTDLILTGTTDTADKSMTILLNNGDGTFTRATSPNGIPAIKAGGVDVCDINADGLADIIYAGECDRERFNWAATGVLVNQGDGTFVNYDYDFIQVRSGASVRAADYRRQGRPSIALMGYGGFGLYDQTGDAHAAAALADNYEQVASFHGTSLKVQADPEPVAGNESDNVTTLSWSPLGPGYRYNYVVKLKDGSMVSAIPCDPSESNRTLLTADTRHATAASRVRLNVNRKDVEMWGVHAIAPDKSTSLVYLDNEEIRTGVENVAAESAAAPGAPEYFTLQGVKVANPSGGIFLERRGNRVVKRVIK